MLVDWFERPRPDAEILVAEAGDGERLGFAMMESPTDYFRRVQHGHVAILAVVFFAISTLPPFVTGSLANGAWLARWIVGGILLFLAVQTLFDLAGRRRRAARSGKSA